MTFKTIKLLLIPMAIIFLTSCQTARWAVITPDESSRRIEWSPEELAQEAAIRTLRQTSEASYHVIRLNQSERPHYHDHHDLAVFILSSEALVHYGSKTIKARQGDVVEVPRGTLHWAELIDSKPSEVYVIFTPAFDGKDTRFAKACCG